jgi:heme A synthase
LTWFQRLLLITIFATFVLVIIGGTVRATDSGLGCPDWPTCHGQLIPPAEKHTLIEFSHRTAATVVGFLFLGVTALTFGTQRKNPLIFWTLFTAGVVLAFQIILGGITVKKELPNGIVALHLGTAMTFMALMISAATVSIMRRRGHAVADGAGQSSFTRMALLTAAAAFATLVLGSYIADSDAALACSGWPLCNGSLVPGGDSAVGLHFLHRLLAGLLGLLLLALIYLGFEERRGKLLLTLTGVAGAAFIAQALIGAANIWTELAAGVVVAHLSLAALLWCLMVSISALSYYLPGREAAPERPASEQAPSKVREWVR